MTTTTSMRVYNTWLNIAYTSAHISIDDDDAFSLCLYVSVIYCNFIYKCTTHTYKTNLEYYVDDAY